MNPDRQRRLIVTKSKVPSPEECFVPCVFRRAILLDLDLPDDRIFDGIHLIRSDRANLIDPDPVLKNRAMDGLKSSQKRAVQASISACYSCTRFAISGVLRLDKPGFQVLQELAMVS